MTVTVQDVLKKVEAEPALRESVEVLLRAFQSDKNSLRRMTYAEFLEWADEDTLAEWVDGEVVMSSPASDKHQDIVGFLSAILRIYSETQHLGILRTAPFQMRIEISGREPDLLFLQQDHVNRLQPNYLDGPADLAVEVISPESVERDRGTKFLEYESAGVTEYWLIDPIRQWMEAYRLTGEGRYATVFAGARDIYRSTVIPGFWLRAEWLWQTPLPPILEVLRELDLIA